MLSSEKQLLWALQAFQYAHPDITGYTWAKTYYDHFIQAGITSMNDVATGCQDDTINMDLEFTGLPLDKIDNITQLLLYNFLPGPVGLRCFRLAQRAAELVDQGQAETTYVHRPESGKSYGEEKFCATGISDWALHVDCAGFVRSVLKHVTKSQFQVNLSDRSLEWYLEALGILVS